MGGCSACFVGVGGSGSQRASSGQRANSSGPLAPKPVETLTLNVTCAKERSSFDISQLRGRPVSLEWTYHDIQEAVWEASYHHPRIQHLYYEGKTVGPGDTLKSVTGLRLGQTPETNLGATIKLDLHANHDRFPQKLGPFSVSRVDIKSTEFDMQVKGQVQTFNLNDFSEEELLGHQFRWEMSAEALGRYGLRARGEIIRGQLSLVSSVTVDGAQRDFLRIPDDAKRVAWSYPIKDRKSVLSVSTGSTTDLRSAEKYEGINSFLSVGGFMYFNEAGSIVGVTSLSIAEGEEDADVHFGKPKRWNAEWTNSLVHRNAKHFAGVTIGALADDGVQFFCWFPPGESIKDAEGKPFPTQPAMAHGGFVYLFHEELLSNESRDVAWDCYFPIKAVDKKRKTLCVAPVQVPCEGKDVTVNFTEKGASGESHSVELSHHNGNKVTADWNVADLKEALWDTVFVHPKCQHIKYKGKELSLKETIASTGGFGLGHLELELEIDHHSFPQQLGPFTIGCVPLKHDFDINKTDWQLKTKQVESYGVIAQFDHIAGRVSSARPVTIDDAHRASLMVPQGAVQSVWAYPSQDADWEPKEAATSAECANADAGMLLNFLSVGGFIYGGADGNIAGVTTLGVAKTGSGAMCFGKPKKWNRDWTISLLRDKRFQMVTIKALQDLEADHFCWLHPGEELLDSDGKPLAAQPQVPLGGFAYLFHKNPRTTKRDKLGQDCYFPMKAMSLSKQDDTTQPAAFQQHSTHFKRRESVKRNSADSVDSLA